MTPRREVDTQLAGGAVAEVIGVSEDVDPILAWIAEMSAFGGLTVPERADVSGHSRRTVDRRWVAGPRAGDKDRFERLQGPLRLFERGRDLRGGARDAFPAARGRTDDEARYRDPAGFAAKRRLSRSCPSAREK